MKNLKKVLALVLAFACAFTMFAGAAFSDQADIKSAEAVDMLSALGIIKGYSDGSYKPDKVVTRAEMAKMIYVIRNGGSDVVTQYEGTTVPFTDVQNVNHWAKGYIAYCYYNGIIAGKSATKFDPDAPVTGQEAAKMALVLLGYDAERAGLVGKAWAMKTNNLASQKDLYKDYSASVTAGAPRQFAAQLLYNTLWACTVKWSEDAKAYEDVTNLVGTGDGVTAKLYKLTAAKKYMGLEEVTGNFVGDHRITNGKKGESKIMLKDGKELVMAFVPENGNEWIGESVKVLYKESKDGVGGLDTKDSVYGVTLSGDTSVVHATLGDLDKVSDAKKIKVGDEEIETTDKMTVWENFVEKGTTVTAANFLNNYKQDSADPVKFIKNDEGKITHAYVNHVEFVKVTGLTKEKIALAGIGTLDINDDMNLDQNVAKDDIVAVTEMYKDNNKYTVIAKADVVKDVKVVNMKGAGTEVQIDGKYVKLADYNNNKITDADYETAKVELKDVYDFVMYGNYWVAAKKVSTSSKDIALVVDKDNSGNMESRVKVLLGDGTKKTYIYNDADGDNESLANIVKGQIYSYSMVGDSEIQLTNGTKDGKGDDLVGLTYGKVEKGTADNIYDSDKKTLNVNGKSYVTTADALTFVKVNNDYYAYSTNTLKSIKNADVTGTQVEYYLDKGEVVAFAVEMSRKPGASASAKQYGYVTADVASSVVDGTEYREVSVWNGKEAVVLKVESDKALDNKIAKGSFIEYTIGADGKTDKTDIKWLKKDNVGAVESFDSNRNLLKIYKNSSNTEDGYNTYNLTKDCVVIGVNTADKKSDMGEGTGLLIPAFVDKKVAKDNIAYVLNKDKEVVAVFVDVKNEFVKPDGMEAGVHVGD